MGQSAGRIVCPGCGTNNFDTLTVCWKCGAPLRARKPAPEIASPADAPLPLGRVAMAVDGVGARLGDHAIAVRAAVALGLLMPYFGLPVGLAFLMCEDADRQRVGRLCVVVSLISMLLHALVGAAALLAMRDYLTGMLTGMQGSGARRPTIEGIS